MTTSIAYITYPVMLIIILSEKTNTNNVNNDDINSINDNPLNNTTGEARTNVFHDNSP